MSDQIPHEIAQRLKEEPALKGYDIQVQVNQDQVILQGVVDTLSEKNLAGQAAALASKRSVNNAVTISTDGTAIDKNILFEVNEELNADPRVQLKDIGVDVKDGTARLVGFAQTQKEAEAAQEAASRARGVKRVLNQVKVAKEDHYRIEPPHTAEEAKARGLTVDREE